MCLLLGVTEHWIGGHWDLKVLCELLPAAVLRTECRGGVGRVAAGGIRAEAAGDARGGLSGLRQLVAMVMETRRWMSGTYRRPHLRVVLLWASTGTGPVGCSRGAQKEPPPTVGSRGCLPLGLTLSRHACVSSKAWAGLGCVKACEPMMGAATHRAAISVDI